MGAPTSDLLVFSYNISNRKNYVVPILIKYNSIDYCRYTDDILIKTQRKSTQNQCLMNSTSSLR
jgi:hypothetical protein